MRPAGGPRILPKGGGSVKQADLFRIDGHVALVTGAASGLGHAYAEVRAENGATVVWTDVDSAGLERATTRLTSAGCKAEGAELDIGDTERLRAVIDDTAERHGRLDAVFANAGISAGPGFSAAATGQLDAVDLAAFQHVIHVNLTSTLLTMQHAARHKKKQRSGSIIATASIAGLRAEPLVGYAYVGAKAAVANLVRQAAVELAPYNVRLNAIAPGSLLTNIRGGAMDRDPELVRQFAEIVPLGRVAQPDEIKGLALLLASPAGSFITGTVMVIDGGITAK
jgi:NAD(P)-dependent dehydrogenase (short-subunit alcohol dehydrogenase family)